MKDERRPDPESFLDLVAQPLKGRLKIYIGAAAGVGKTYKMLEEAHQLREKGIDVVQWYIAVSDGVSRRGVPTPIGTLSY